APQPNEPHAIGRRLGRSARANEQHRGARGPEAHPGAAYCRRVENPRARASTFLRNVRVVAGLRASNQHTNAYNTLLAQGLLKRRPMSPRMGLLGVVVLSAIGAAACTATKGDNLGLGTGGQAGEPGGGAPGAGGEKATGGTGAALNLGGSGN